MFYTNSRQNWWHDFLKKSKNHVFGVFLTIFGHFCPTRTFSKKSGSVSQNYIWDPNTMLSFRKKILSQFWEFVQTDGRTDGRMDRHYFIGPFRAEGLKCTKKSWTKLRPLIIWTCFILSTRKTTLKLEIRKTLQF